MPLRAFARLTLALAAMAAGTAARAQDDIPPVVSPLRVESDHNGVNLVTGKTAIDPPVLSVPGAPNLRFDRVQNAAPYVTGRVSGQPGEIPLGNYSVHSGATTSETFRCIDVQDCASVTGTGSTFRPGVNAHSYRQAGSGAVYQFNLRHVKTAELVQYYASGVTYPSGETISYAYQAVSGGGFGQIFYRPTTITSNLGYFISLTYQSDDFGSASWGAVGVATLYASAAPTVPLGKLTYEGATIRDLGGREHVCQGCSNGLGLDIEVAAGSMQLPGETLPALQVAAHPGAPVVQSVTRDGVQWTYAYANLRAAPGTMNWLYDSLTVTGPDGYQAVYAMHAVQNRNVLTAVTDSIGRSTSYAFDGGYRPIQMVYPEGNEAGVVYDEAGNVVSRRMKAKPDLWLPDITQAAFYPVPAIANLCTVLCWRALWSRDGLGRQTDFAYNNKGQLIERTDPADADGVRRRTVIGYETSAAGISRRSVVRVCGTGAACGTNTEIRTEYDYWGDTLLPSVERRIDAVRNETLETLHGYDAAGRLVSTDGPLPGADDATYSRYDVHGRRTWEIGARGSTGLRIARRHEYRPSDDRLVSTETGTLPDENSTILAVFSRTDFSWDGRRNPVREAVSASGATSALLDRSFDLSGRLVCEARRMNPAAFASPPLDACALGPQGAGSNAFGPDRITRNVYDAAGQRLQLREGVGTADEAAEATLAYSPNGRITTVIDGNGNRAALRYDGHDRQDRWTFPSTTRPGAYDDATQASALASAGVINAGDYEQYGHDDAGNRLSLRKRDDSIIAYQYDALNRVIVKLVPERAGLAATHSRDVYYGYDLRGLQTHARFDSPSGEGVTSIYDGFGRLRSTTLAMDNASRTLAYEHEAGNRIRITHPDGVFFTSEHDGLGRQVWTREQSGAGLVYSVHADHGALHALGLGNGAVTSFGYDGAKRLNAILHYFAAPTGNVMWIYGRNPAGQIATQSRDNDAFAWTSHYPVDRAYTTNGLNQYSAAGSASFAYDANGNLVSDGSRSYVYDVEHRLISASPNVTLRYDPLGRLYEVSGASGTTRFLYDGDALVAEYSNSDTMLRRYVHNAGADTPAVWYEGAGLSDRRFLHADHQGSIVARTAATAAVTAINAYDEYGIPAAGNTGRFQYIGQIWIPELGMYHYKARVYSPNLGRFLQTDLVGYDDQFNLYAYVGNDPVNHVDPDGAARIAVGGGVICLRTAPCRNTAIRWLLRALQGARAAPQSRQLGPTLYRGLSTTDVRNLAARGAVLPKLPNVRSVTPEQHVAGLDSGYVSMSRSIQVAEHFATHGDDPSGYVIAIDSGRLPGMIDTGRGERLESEVLRELAAREQEVLTTVIPATAVIGGGRGRGRPPRRPSSNRPGRCPDLRPDLQCGSGVEIRD